MLLESQQPVGHEAELHTHCPLTHCWPDAQTVPPGPHEQAPPTQRSALLVSQVVHVPVVGEPQWRKLVCDVSQVEPSMQQPVQPLEPLHTQVAALPVPVQVVPAGHGPPVEPHTQLPPLHRFALVASQLVQLAPPPPQ